MPTDELSVVLAWLGGSLVAGLWWRSVRVRLRVKARSGSVSLSIDVSTKRLPPAAEATRSNAPPEL